MTTRDLASTCNGIAVADAVNSRDADSEVFGFEFSDAELDLDHLLTSSAPAAHNAVLESAVAPATTARLYTTSLQVFRRHFVYAKQADDLKQVHAEGILSRACYEDWLSTRSRLAAEPERTFQRVMTCCITGTDGRLPFSPEEETAVLEQIRHKRVWPAFAGTPFTIGSKGFRTYVSSTYAHSVLPIPRDGTYFALRHGYHEKARLEQKEATAPPAGKGRALKLFKRASSPPSQKSDR